MFFWMQFFALILLAVIVYAPTTRQPVARMRCIAIAPDSVKGRASLQDWSAPTGGAVGHNAATKAINKSEGRADTPARPVLKENYGCQQVFRIQHRC